MVTTRFIVDLTEADDGDMGDFIGALHERLLEGDYVLLDGITYLAHSGVLFPVPS